MKKFASIILTCALALSIAGCSQIEQAKKTQDYNNRIDEIMADSIEIERKWLVDPNNIPYDLSQTEIFEIEQTYINFSPEIRIRRVNDITYSCTMKANMSDDGMVRDELEVYIKEEEYNELYKKKEGNTILKTRYQFLTEDGNLMCIDIFHGDLDGLAYMEIEFTSEEESNSYQEPDWVIMEVTGDKNYKNGYLARYGIPKSFYNI